MHTVLTPTIGKDRRMQPASREAAASEEQDQKKTIADDEAAADDEAMVIAESAGVRDEAIVSGEVLMLSLSRLRLIT